MLAAWKKKVEIDIAVKFAKKCADSVSHIKNAESAYAADVNDAASYAVAASAAAYAAYAEAAAAYATAAYVAVAYDKQLELNKQFLIDCIKDWEESH